jgi:hypothetical protein
VAEKAGAFAVGFVDSADAICSTSLTTIQGERIRGRRPIGNPEGAEVLAKVDQSADGGGKDVDGRAPGNPGAWESSGIVDASETFGPGAFLINVQAHTLWVERAPGDDNNGHGQPDFTSKREGGQLALIRVPGA